MYDFSLVKKKKRKEEVEQEQQQAEKQAKQQAKQENESQQGNGYWYRDHYGRKKWHSNEQQQTWQSTTNFALLDAYMTLGVVEAESDEDIKDVSKNLVKRWHPDRFIQDGEQAVHRAEEKTKEINKAYDLICKARGIK